MSQAMPMAVNKVNTLVIKTNVGALQKHIIVKVIGDIDIKAQLFSQGSAVNLEQQGNQQYHFKNLSQQALYTLKVIIAGETELTLSLIHI